MRIIPSIVGPDSTEPAPRLECLAAHVSLRHRRTGLPSRATSLPPHLAALRDRLRAEITSAAGVLPLGDDRIDRSLPGHGLPLGQLHEVGGNGLEHESGAVTAAFCSALAGRIAPGRPVIWIAPSADLYPPGLIPFGLDPARLVMIRPRDDAEALGAMETALREGGAGAVVGEIGRLERIASRRMQLACLRHGVTGFLLRRWPYGRKAADREATSVVTRWDVTTTPSVMDGKDPGPPRWRVALTHARGGRPGAWLVQATQKETADEADPPHPFRVVAELADHPPDALPARRLAG